MQGFKMVAVQEVTITKEKAFKGSNRVVRNYDLNGTPFGQVWTYKTKGETHKWHAAKSNGAYIGAFDTEADADVAIRSEM